MISRMITGKDRGIRLIWGERKKQSEMEGYIRMVFFYVES
jgi:hypothetical protein